MSIPLSVIVCDDELMARKRAARLVSEIAGVERVIECASGEEVLRALEENDVDVAVLDVNMPGMTGIELTAKMPEDRPYIVFLTAHPEHAVDAFDVGAVDYLMKPVDAVRLEKALDRARKQLDGPPRGSSSNASSGSGGSASGDASKEVPARLAIPTRDGAVLLNPQEVTHAVFDGQLVTVFTKSRSVLTDFTLQDLEAKLAEQGRPMERVHRRAILSLDHVEELTSQTSGGYIARVGASHKVEISRQSARKLRRRLGI